MERVTATLDRYTLTRIRRVSGPRGVSGFLAVAAKEMLEMLDELDAKHGAPSPSVRAEVAREARRIFRRR